MKKKERKSMLGSAQGDLLICREKFFSSRFAPSTFISTAICRAATACSYARRDGTPVDRAFTNTLNANTRWINELSRCTIAHSAFVSLSLPITSSLSKHLCFGCIANPIDYCYDLGDSFAGLRRLLDEYPEPQDRAFEAEPPDEKFLLHSSCSYLPRKEAE